MLDCHGNARPRAALVEITDADIWLEEGDRAATGCRKIPVCHRPSSGFRNPARGVTVGLWIYSTSRGGDDAVDSRHALPLN